MVRSYRSTMSWSMSNRRLSAFTLIELMAGMIVSGIILTAAFTFIQIVSGKLKSISTQKGVSEEVSLLYSTLYTDFQTAETVTEEESKLIMHSDSLSVAYEFTGDKILRTFESHTDTFHIPTSQPRLTQHETESEIAGLRFEVYTNGQTQEVHLLRMQDVKSKFRSDD